MDLIEIYCLLSSLNQPMRYYNNFQKLLQNLILCYFPAKISGLPGANSGKSVLSAMHAVEFVEPGILWTTQASRREEGTQWIQILLKRTSQGCTMIRYKGDLAVLPSTPTDATSCPDNASVCETLDKESS